MATSRQNTLMVYAALVTAFTTAVLSYIDYRGTKRIADDPYARPDAWTASDEREFQKHHQEQHGAHAKLHAAIEKRIDKLSRELKELEVSAEEWRENHLEFAFDRSVKQTDRDSKQDAQIDELFRMCERDQIYYRQRPLR